MQIVAAGLMSLTTSTHLPAQIGAWSGSPSKSGTRMPTSLGAQDRSPERAGVRQSLFQAGPLAWLWATGAVPGGECLLARRSLAPGGGGR
jgi:hypothetical protein